MLVYILQRLSAFSFVEKVSGMYYQVESTKLLLEIEKYWVSNGETLQGNIRELFCLFPFVIYTLMINYLCITAKQMMHLYVFKCSPRWFQFMYKIGKVCIDYNRLECGSRFGILLRDAIFTFIMIEILQKSSFQAKMGCQFTFMPSYLTYLEG